jgi:hypothetical protein
MDVTFVFSHNPKPQIVSGRYAFLAKNISGYIFKGAQEKG